jgi:hypothetical protein
MHQKWVLVTGGVGFSGSLMSDNEIPFESRKVAIQIIAEKRDLNGNGQAGKEFEKKLV